jgi:hypothetical protein
MSTTKTVHTIYEDDPRSFDEIINDPAEKINVGDEIDYIPNNQMGQEKYEVILDENGKNGKKKLKLIKSYDDINSYGGKKTRKSRKGRKSRKSRKGRKGRKSRKSRKGRK